MSINLLLLTCLFKMLLSTSSVVKVMILLMHVEPKLLVLLPQLIRCWQRLKTIIVLLALGKRHTLQSSGPGHSSGLYLWDRQVGIAVTFRSFSQTGPGNY